MMEVVYFISQKEWKFATEVSFLSSLDAPKRIYYMCFFAVESFDVFLLENIQYEVRFVVEGSKLFFDEIVCMFWVMWFANWRIGFYERWLVHILSGRMLDFELRMVKV